MGPSTESEAKFDADAGWALHELGGLVTHDIGSTELVAVYWDTADHRLNRAGVTLRRRVADGQQVKWTLKLPKDRTGWIVRRQEVTSDDTAHDPPSELVRLVTGLTINAPLKPIAELRTDRRRRRAGTDRWSDAIEITDDRVTSTVDGLAGPAFRQIEVELLRDDADEVLDTAVTALRDAGLRPSHDASKLRRVLGALDERASANERRGVTVEAATSVAIGRGMAAMLDADPWIRLEDNPAAVHRSRKAIRRLRSELKVLRPVLDSAASDALHDELKWFAALLGQVRDLHVLRTQLLVLADELGIDPDALTPLLKAVDGQLVIERSHLLSAMDGDRYVDLVRRASELEARVPLRDGVSADQLLARELSRSGRKAWKKIKQSRRQALDQPSAEHLHTVRKKAKRIRAAAQLAQETEQRPKRARSAKHFARAAGALKDELGDLHDLDVLIAWLDGRATRLNPEAAYVAGRVRERAVTRRSELQSVWVRTWNKLDRPGVRRWTH